MSSIGISASIRYCGDLDGANGSRSAWWNLNVVKPGTFHGQSKWDINTWCALHLKKKTPESLEQSCCSLLFAFAHLLKLTSLSVFPLVGPSFKWRSVTLSSALVRSRCSTRHLRTLCRLPLGILRDGWSCSDDTSVPDPSRVTHWILIDAFDFVFFFFLFFFLNLESNHFANPTNQLHPTG